MLNHPLPILDPKNGNKKIKRGIKKRKNKKYQRDKREVITKRVRILKVSIYLYKIYE